MILFELLTGQRPYDVPRLAFDAIRDAISENDVPRPSTVAADARNATPVPTRRLRGDLDVIVVHTLQKEPERRYASVAHLRDDLERWLTHQPITARPPSMAYVMRRFARRHRAIVATICVVILAIASVTFVQLRASRAIVDREQLVLEQKNRAERLLSGLAQENAFRALEGGDAHEAARMLLLAATADNTVTGQIVRSEIRRLSPKFSKEKTHTRSCTNVTATGSFAAWRAAILLCAMARTLDSRAT